MAHGTRGAFTTAMSRAPALELTACPVCGGSDSEELATAEAIRDEVETLWQFHTRRLHPDTPPEHLTDRVAFSQRPPLRVVQCRECGLVYRNPRERAHELAGVYQSEAPDADVLAALFETQRDAYRAQARRLHRVLGRRGSGLEVGSYVGGFLAAARELRLEVEGLDVNETASAFARKQGFRVTISDLESWREERSVDAVAIWNCFDQLPDPRRAAMAARALLRTGGILAIRVPNGGFYAALRPHLSGARTPLATAMLAHNNLLSFPYRHGFTVGALTRLLETIGFSIVSTFGDTLVPIADRWTRRWAAAEERAVKAMLKMVAKAGGARRAPWFEVYARLS
jgi:SAM-dependent methyltransferase